MSVCEVRISELDSPDEKVQEIVQDMGHTHILLRGTPERAKLGVERGFFRAGILREHTGYNAIFCEPFT